MDLWMALTAGLLCLATFGLYRLVDRLGARP